MIHEEKTKVLIAMPKTLLSQIDEKAKQNFQNRSEYIRSLVVGDLRVSKTAASTTGEATPLSTSV